MYVPLLKGELKIDELIFETVHSFCEDRVSVYFDSLLVDSLLGLFWSMDSSTTFWFILSPCIFSVSRLDWVSLWLMTSVASSSSSCKRLDLVSKLTLLTLKKKFNLDRRKSWHSWAKETTGDFMKKVPTATYTLRDR